MILLAGCGGGTTSPGSEKGGLHGTVTRWPTMPVCQEGIPCSEPASGAKLVFTPDDGDATSVIVAEDGSYSVSLAPGVYTVSVSSLQIGGIEPSTVHVAAGHSRAVDFQIDTGIR